MTHAPSQLLQDSAKGSSFHAAMLLLPRGKRKALLTLYALCRALDDAVDDAPSPAAALAELDAWQAEMDCVFNDGLPVTRLAQEFQAVHQHYHFAREDVQAMLTALRMDAEQQMLRPSLAQLEAYCYGVASAVGLLSMRIFGCPQAEARPFAIALGHALQRTNILRDVCRDAQIGRIYLPQEYLHERLSPAQLSRSSEPARTACAALGDDAKTYFLEADRLSASLSARLIAPALAMRDVYACYWQKLSAHQWHAPEDGHLHLSLREKTGLAHRASRYLRDQFLPIIL